MSYKKKNYTVGILSRRVPDDPDRIFGPPTTFFSECCRAAEKIGLQAVIFEAEDYDSESGIIKASKLVNESWVDQTLLSLPDVIYDRAPLNNPLYTPVVNQVRSKLVKSGLPFINPFSILQLAADKFATYRYLYGCSIPHPETNIFTKETLIDFLNRFDHVYIKPIYGSNGEGIIEVQRRSPNSFYIHTNDHQGIDTTQPIYEEVISRLGNSVLQKSVYIVQQGIRMEPSCMKGYPRFDLRVVMQKNEFRSWELTGIVARVCQSDVPTTNLSTGARAEVAEPLLDDVYGPDKQRKIIASISSICYKICDRIDHDMCAFGELGIDILTDTAGQPWVIEINGKPGRQAFKRIAYSEDVTEEERQKFLQIRQRSVAMPFRYASTLKAERSDRQIEAQVPLGVPF